MACSLMSTTSSVCAARFTSGQTAALSRRSKSANSGAPLPGGRIGLVAAPRLRDRRWAVVASATFVDVGEETETVENSDPREKLPRRLPKSQEQLPFSIGDIRRAIPPHCFQRSALRSFSYLARDLIAIAALVYASTFIDALPVAVAVKYGILWPAYWFWVGAFGVGVWIISHECGHGAFSERPWLNDLVGFFGHSILFIPYFSWKHSHRRHHANTASVHYDEAFVPITRRSAKEEEKEDDEATDFFRTSAPMRLVSLPLMLIFGFPLYLLMNFGGREYTGWPNHFNPWSPVFEPRERWEIFMSDMGLVAVVAALCLVGQSFGFATVLKTYIIPYFVVHAWLVLITFLHHCHPRCPHYDDKEWNWLKGALSTIDRNFGFLNVIFHRITDTHVVHHLFSQIPHYHALEATEAIKPVIGPYYKVDDRNLLKALWEDFRDTAYAAPDKRGEGVLWFRRQAKEWS